MSPAWRSWARNLARNLARHGLLGRRAQPDARAGPRRWSRSTGDEGAFVAGRDARGLRRRAGAPAPRRDHGQGGRPHRRGDRGARARCSRRATSSSTAATRTSPTPGGARRRCASAACTSSAPASPAARRARCSGRASCPAARRSPTQSLGPHAREDRRAGRRHARAARTSARTAPGTSSRWCTTASSTPTCSSSPRPTTCCGHGLGADAGRARGDLRASGTPATWSRSSSRSPPRCSGTSTRRPASRSWT